MSYSVFTNPPLDFSPTVEVSSCYLECDNKILLLKRHPDRPQGKTWGVPGGKIEKNEQPREALIREVYEEVGLKIQDCEIKEIGQLFIRLPHVDYIYHMFFVLLQELPLLNLELTEHDEARWVTYLEALQFPLIKGGKEALNYYQEFRLYE